MLKVNRREVGIHVLLKMQKRMVGTLAAAMTVRLPQSE